jgi:hypothetical protein
MRADVKNARSRVVCGCEMIEGMERSGGGIVTVGSHKWNLWSLCLFVSLSLCLFVSLSLCLFVSLSLCLFVSLSLCLFVSLSLCLFLNFSFNSCFLVVSCY